MDENTARRAAVEFLGGQVQESGFRVGVPISCRRPVGAQGACGEGSTRRRVWVSRMTYASGNLHRAGLMPCGWLCRCGHELPCRAGVSSTRGRHNPCHSRTPSMCAA